MLLTRRNTPSTGLFTTHPIPTASVVTLDGHVLLLLLVVVVQDVLLLAGRGSRRESIVKKRVVVVVVVAVPTVSLLVTQQ